MKKIKFYTLILFLLTVISCSKDNDIIIDPITIEPIWTSVNSGGVYTIGIKSDNTLWAWGWNIDGELGDGTNNDQNIPIKINDNTLFEFISTGNSHTQAIKFDGTLWAWGYNYTGQLGDNTNFNRNVPTQIGNDDVWNLVSAGMSYTLAIKNDGTLWAWGNNSGNFGDGLSGNYGNDNYSPRQIGNDVNWLSVSTGRDFSIALKKDGTIWSCGQNYYGQLGNGTNSFNSSTDFNWTQMGNSNNWKTISTGDYFTIGLKNDGTLWAWGDNSSGQLGNSSNDNSYSPIQIGNDNNWQVISTGYSHTLAIKTNGTLWAWGGNYHGQIGDGTNLDKILPFQIGSDTNWEKISTNLGHNMAIKTDGTLWGWGWNKYGQLGDGSEINKTIPTQIINN